MANPLQVDGFFARMSRALAGDGGPELTAHFHNTRGQGIANAVAALGRGIDSFESSFGELGGCPVPPARPGTSPPRTSSRSCTRWGSRPASTSEALLAASREVQAVLGRPLGAHLLTAGPVDWGGAGG